MNPRVWTLLVGVFSMSLCLCGRSFAQDVSSRWMDRVIQELAVERGPMEPQTQVDLAGGLLVYHDDNILLTEDDEESDTILVPFAQARVRYAEEHLELLGDLMGDYKAYSDFDDLDDGEVRFYGRAHYAGSEADLGVVLMVRRESDPVSSLFLDRIERWVFDALPRASVDLTSVLALEANVHWQAVRFDEDLIADVRDNNNWRVALGAIYKTEGLFDFVVEGGALAIEYLVDVAPPDVDGHFIRGGVRGKPTDDLDVQVLVGYVHAESDDFASGLEVEEDDTVDAMVVIRWRPEERWSFTGTYTRTATFFGGNDPWAIVNTIYALLEYEIDEQWKVGGRVVYDILSGALDTERRYLSAGGDLTYRILENVVLEGGATFRTGETEPLTGPTTEYDNLLVFVGIAATY